MSIVHGLTTDGATVPIQVDSTGRLVASNRVLAQSAVAVSVGSTTDETTLATITVPANSMGPNGRIVVTHTWTCTNNANAKTPRVRWGGGAGTAVAGIALASNASGRFQMEVMNRNAANSQLLSPTSGGGAFSASTGSHQTASVNTAADTTIVITGQKASAGDTLTLESYNVQIFYGA